MLLIFQLLYIYPASIKTVGRNKQKTANFISSMLINKTNQLTLSNSIDALTYCRVYNLIS